MGPDSGQVSSMLGELASQKVLTQYINREKLEPKKDTLRNRALKILSPLRASELKIPISDKFIKIPDEIKPSQELIERAQSLAKSIEGATDPAAVEIMAPLLDIVELEETPETDKFLSLEVQHALGFLALHKSLQLVSTHPDKVKPYGVVKEYLDGIDAAKSALAKIDLLAQKLPIFTKPASETMSSEEKWTEQDQTLELMKNAQQLELSLPSYLSLIPQLKKGLDFSNIWQREGLSPTDIPTVNITLDQVMILARFYAWVELAEDTPEEEREIAFVSWKNDKEKLMSLTTHLSMDEKAKARTELATIENALFEPV